MDKIIKRNGKEVDFDPDKIRQAVTKANKEVDVRVNLAHFEIEAIVEKASETILNNPYSMNVEDIQDMVELLIAKYSGPVAQKYIRYRYTRELKRKANTTDEAILTLLDYENEEVKQENSNKNPVIASVQRDYMAGEASKDICRRIILPPDVVEAHDEGIIHFHDMDYFSQRMFNCCLININDMLWNGTVISETKIDRPNSFATAANVATQIVAQVASNQYGGQTISLTDLLDFVDISRIKWRRKIRVDLEDVGFQVTEEQVNNLAEKRLLDELKSGIQTIQYQVITLMTTNGQAPFITVWAYLNEPENRLKDAFKRCEARKDEEGFDYDTVKADLEYRQERLPQMKKDLATLIQIMFEQRILGVKNEQGEYVTPAFPKIVYCLEEDNITPDGEYYYLTELAAKCTAKRMVPDYVSEKIMLQYKIDDNGEGHCYPPMGCRSFLTPYVDKYGVAKYYGRFNQGVVTINLPYIALLSGGDEEKFWKIFEEKLELCHKALRCRHDRLKGTLSNISPIHWQNGAIGRIPQATKIDEFLYGGYSTISLGYAGLYETVKYMKGVSHTDEKGKPFGLAVMQKMNDKCAEWKAAENIAYSVYGTPLESTTYKFAKAIRKRFGRIEDVTDHNYITNSYHVCVREKIGAFEKLGFEAEFQKLSPGGAISYVEVPNMQDNIPAVLEIIRFIYDTIMYAELNTKSDYCCACGSHKEILIYEDESGKLGWRCSECGNTNQDLMHVARRTCGYIGSQFWNQGRTQEIRDRVMHVSNEEYLATE